MTATVKEGTSIEIEVVECAEHQALEGDLGGLLSDCHPGTASDKVTASQWAVEGVPLGNATPRHARPGRQRPGSHLQGAGPEADPNTVA